MSQNTMIDLETLDTNDEAVILTVGLVDFDTEKCYVDENTALHIRMDLNEMMASAGRSISASTLEFWIRQPQPVSESLFEGQIHLISQLSKILYERMPGGAHSVWSNGSNFDISILEDLFEKRVPWHFWDVRDVRTINQIGKEVFGYPLKERGFDGRPHNALDDAIHQAEYVCEIFSLMRGTKT